MNRYIISVTPECSIEHILTALLNRGYVMGSPRIKDMNSIKKEWSSYHLWRYVKIGTDIRCKNVLHSGCYVSSNKDIPILLEDFLKLNL